MMWHVPFVYMALKCRFLLLPDQDITATDVFIKYFVVRALLEQMEES